MVAAASTCSSAPTAATTGAATTAVACSAGRAMDGRSPEPARPARLVIANATTWPGTPLTCWRPIHPGLTPHGLRHSQKPRMAEEGIPEILAEQRLGQQPEGPTPALRGEPVLRAADLVRHQELGSGARGTRTPDPVLAKHVLFQLSYSPARRAPRVPAAGERSGRRSPGAVRRAPLRAGAPPGLRHQARQPRTPLPRSLPSPPPLARRRPGARGTR